ncbi:MAG: type II secretion system protein GspG, partial [Candidatus Sumerlaeota bacterium]
MKKKRFISAAFAAGIFIFSATAESARADAIVTMSDRRIEGRIVSEDTDSLMLDSPRYGQLRFFKRNLKTIERSDPNAASAPAPAPAPPAANDTPFGGFDGPAQPAPSTAVAPPVAADDPFASAAPPSPASAAFDASAGTAVSSERKAFGGVGVPVNGVPAAPSDSPFGFAGDPGAAALDVATPPATNGSAFSNTPAPVNVDAIAGFSNSAPARSILDESAADGPQDSAPVPAATAATASTSPEVKGPPEVKMGFDGAAYGITAKTPIEARSGESGKWTPVTEDIQFRAGQEFRTNATKRVRVLMRGRKDELRASDQTTITVEKISPDVDQVALVVQRGSLWGEIEPRKTPESYTLRSPELTAAIRGTRFGFDRVQGATRVTALAGAIDLRTELTGLRGTVGEGQTAIVNSLGQILDIGPADPALLSRWDSWDGSSEAQTSAVAKTIMEDNEKRDAELREYEHNMEGAKYQDRLNEYARAFEKYAADTKQIHEDQNGWAALRYNQGAVGWQGPYVQGAIPPVDPWRRALVYKRVQSPTGRVLGRVYSLWQDGRDQGGENPSVDKVAMVMYYNLDVFKNDPKVNPPQK